MQLGMVYGDYRVRSSELVDFSGRCCDLENLGQPLQLTNFVGTSQREKFLSDISKLHHLEQF